MTQSKKILVVAPFTHQNGHFVTFPRDVCCGLAKAGHEVTLIHPRPFAAELEWFDTKVRRICLRDELDSSPRWWKEVWYRLADRPSNQCLAWIIWKINSSEYDLALWTDFQQQSNLWPLTLSQLLRLNRVNTAFFEHHPPNHTNSRADAKVFDLERLRVGDNPMVVFSRTHEEAWRQRLGKNFKLLVAPYGVWPNAKSDLQRKAARSRLGISATDWVLLVFGVQNIARKNIDTLFAAMEGFTPTRPMTLIFAGKSLHNTQHPFCSVRRHNVDTRVINEFISEELADNLFAASDAVWANYREFPGASGVLQQSIGSGRIAITSRGGEIGRISRQHKISMQVTDESPSALRACLTDTISIQSDDQVTWEEEISKLAKNYSWPHIMQQIIEQLLPTKPNAKP